MQLLNFLITFFLTHRIILITICCMLLISYFDVKTMSFPIIIWLIPFLIAFSMSEKKLFAILFIAFAFIVEKLSIGIGSGDLLVLSLLATHLSFPQILWVTQISASLGIIFYVYYRKNKAIPFVPFLTIAYFVILLM